METEKEHSNSRSKCGDIVPDTKYEIMWQERKDEGQHTPPQRETGRSREERGGRSRRGLLLQTAGAGEAGR